MPDNFVSGNTGYVALSAARYQFNKWRFPIAANNKKFLAFGSNFQRTLPGPLGGQVTCEGFYDAGNMPLTVGALVELHLGWMTGVEMVINARVGDIDFGNELKTGDDPGGTISVVFDTHGSFNIILS